MYDTGNLFVCTQNVTTASAVCGELYVEYEVELLTPIWENLSGTSGLLGAAAVAGQGPAALFGTAALAGVGQIQLSAAGANVVSFSGAVVGQEYLLSYGTIGTVLGTPSIGTVVGLTFKTNIGAAVNAGFTQSALNATYTATATSGSFTITQAATLVSQAVNVMSLIPTQAF